MATYTYTSIADGPWLTAPPHTIPHHAGTPLLHLLRSFTCDGLPVLLFQFPEGDRIDARVRQQSLSFAQKERRPQLLHVLLPRTTGFNACIEGLRCVVGLEGGDGSGRVFVYVVGG